MEGLEYQTLVDIYKAREFLQKYSSLSAIEKRNDRTYSVGYVTYSPQEILILPREDLKPDWYPEEALPKGVSRHWFRSPNKEYISFPDGTGVRHYYLIPKDGLRLRKKNELYIALNPIQDYSIRVDRAAAKKAREDGEEFIKYITTIWNMVMCPPDNERPKTSVDFENLPDYEDKDGWFRFLLQAKYPRPWYGVRSYQLSTVTQKIRNKFTREGLAYHITPVPTTRMDHTEHWGQIENLRKAGKLDELERTNRKSRAAGSGGH